MGKAERDGNRGTEREGDTAMALQFWHFCYLHWQRLTLGT